MNLNSSSVNVSEPPASLEEGFSNFSSHPNFSNASTTQFCCSEKNESTSTVPYTELPSEFFPISTSDGIVQETKSYMKEGIENYYESIETQYYTTPFSIIFLNIFLCSFLMIVIGIAVYPAVKRYCDTSFPPSNNSILSESLNWIEDTDEIVSVFTDSADVDDHNAAFVLLNAGNNPCYALGQPSPEELNQNPGDLEVIAEVTISTNC